jgi:hypothetical protein
MIPTHVKDRRTDVVDLGESDMASFFLDIVKQAFAAEIVVISALNFQGGFVSDKSVVTLADLLEEFPIESADGLMVRSIPGAIIAKMIKRSRLTKGTESNCKERATTVTICLSRESNQHTFLQIICYKPIRD